MLLQKNKSNINNELDWNYVHENYNLIFNYLEVGKSFFKRIESCSEDIYLLHVTTESRYKDILKSGNIYPSGGCLVGSIYCTPLLKIDENKWRIHNLGAYYYNVEIPKSIDTNEFENHLEQQVGIIFKIKIKYKNSSSLLGINYLKLGNIHYNIYQNITSLLSFKEQNRMNVVILEKLKKSLLFLESSYNKYHSFNLICHNYIDEFRQNISNLPILGYIYFEAISEFIITHQDDEISKKYLLMDEVYNWNYKELMFDLYPDFFSNFNLGKFNPEIKVLEQKILKKGFISNFNSDSFQLFIAKYLLKTLMYSSFKSYDKGIDFKYLKSNPLILSETFEPLIGHIIHRELRNFKRYPDFYLYFDQQKAIELWKYWNNNNISISFNGLTPKGEVGINPANLQNIEYETFLAKSVHEENNLFYLEKGQSIDIKVNSKLIDIYKSVRRPKFND